MENISVFDLVATVLLAATTFLGGMRGVVSQISSIAVWILSGLAAARYGFVVGDFVSIPEPWRAPVSALIVFCAALLALNFAFQFVKQALSLAGLREFDRQMGALFGCLKGCAICVVLTFFCVLASDKTRELVDDSKTGPYLTSVTMLLKSAFPQSEMMTRFEDLALSMESMQAKNGKTPSLKAEIADLETYLKNNVLTEEAVEVVEEAKGGADASKDGRETSGWSRFLNDLRGSWGTRENAENVENDENDENDANGSKPSFWNWGANGDEESEEETKGNGGGTEGWESWDFWGSRENWEDEEARDARNNGYYSEYAENADYAVEETGERNVGGYYDERDARLRNDWADASNGLTDLATFLTNLAGVGVGTARSTTESYDAAEIASERRTANYAAADGESLNNFLGLPATNAANEWSPTPVFNDSAPRTTDGAILGRPSASATPLIPPLPY